MTSLRIVVAASLLAPAPALAQKASKAKDAPVVAQARTGELSSPLVGPNLSVAASTAPSSSLPVGGPTCGGTEERQQLDRLSAQVQIEQQRTLQRLRPVNEEREEAAARNALLTEKQRADLAPLEFESRRLQIENQLAEEKFRRSTADTRFQRERLRLENDVAREKLAAEQAKADLEKLRMDIAMRELDFQSRKLRAEAELAEHKTVALKVDLDLRDKKEKWKTHANRDPEYALEPFKDGVLTITDRRIPLNGPIIPGSAAFIQERIDYFNNKDGKLPIFIVIDRSPGGSVMEGYRILKAMRESKAPVHVVVKSYAASMAAVITTLAPKSYAYPNAIILHHQIMSMSAGNLTQQKEQLEKLKEWYRRLAEPVAKKSGMSLEKFTARMYEKSSDGDWDEFADEAAKLKWVDHVVHEVRETGMLKEPDDRRKVALEEYFGAKEELDPQGNRFVRLPRLQPYDGWWVYNRDNYYR